MEHYENQSSSNLDLAQFDDAFETAEVEEREFEAVPDGKYQVNVDRVELTRAQTSGNPMLKWTLRILAPTHKGRLLWRNNVMASNENIYFNRRIVMADDTGAPGAAMDDMMPF